MPQHQVLDSSGTFVDAGKRGNTLDLTKIAQI
jgi:hypothetical protein